MADGGARDGEPLNPVQQPEQRAGGELDKVSPDLARMVAEKMGAANLETVQREIDILCEQPEQKEVIDPRTVERLKREVEFADLLDAAIDGQEISPKQKEIIISAYERRLWGNVFSKLQTGDEVFFFLTPSSDQDLSIKNLNDHVLGPTITDELIKTRREATQKAFLDFFKTKGVEIEKSEINLLQDYKSGVFRVPDGVKIDSKQLGDFVVNSVNIAVKEFIKALKPEQAQSPDRLRKIQEEIELSKTNFLLTYGHRSVENDGAKNKILALTRASFEARWSAIYPEEPLEGNYSEKVKEKLTELSKELRKGGQKIIVSGRELNLYTAKAGDLCLNPDVMRIIRKGKFNTDDPRKDSVMQYWKLLNVPDLVKPFTREELNKKSNGANQKDTDKNLSQKAEELTKHEKDDKCTSDGVFHQGAIEISHCGYISVDVLDLGVRQAVDHERILQNINAENEDESLLSAGDKMTEELRRIRLTIRNLCFASGLFDPSEPLLSKVGGDELTIAVNLYTISDPKKLEQLIFQIKKETGVRITLATTERKESTSGTIDIEERIKHHILAIQETEKGISEAKELENAIRQTELRSTSWDKDDPAMTESLKILNQWREFVVIHEQKEFFAVMVNEAGFKKSTKELKKEFDAMFNL